MGTATATLAPVVQSPARIAWRRFRRNKLGVYALGVLALIVVLCVGAPLFTAHGPLDFEITQLRQPPSADHIFGTDTLGRDVWTRTLYGGRASLAVGLAAAFLATAIGIVLGVLSGYFGRWIDMVIMRGTDVVMTFPPIIIMLTVAAFVGPGLVNVILIIGGLRWTGAARLVRGQILSLKNQDFVLAARTQGLPARVIIVRHLLPHVVAPLVANVTFAVSLAILTEAGLSFLGLGVPLPTPTWGNMMESARDFQILQDQPWMWLPPAGFALLTVLSINFIGDGLRDAFDPEQLLPDG